MVHSDLQAATVAGGQDFWLAPAAIAVDRPDSVDHETRGQLEAWGKLGVAGLATAECGTGCPHKLVPGCTVDGAVDAAAACEGGIGGINDDIDIKSGDITLG